MKCFMCEEDTNLEIHLCEDCIRSLQEIKDGGFSVVCKEDVIDAIEGLYIDAIECNGSYEFVLGFQTAIQEAIKTIQGESDIFEH